MSSDRRVLFDVNALIALTLSTHQHHRAAHAFLAERRAWATTPMTEAALFRLLLNPAVTGRELGAHDVAQVARGFRSDPRWQFIPDSSSLAAPEVETRVLMGHQQVTDLHLVNLAASTGAVLATFDRAMTGWLAPGDRDHVVPIEA